MTNIIRLSSEENSNKKEDKDQEKIEEQKIKEEKERNEKAKKLYSDYLDCNSDPKTHLSECNAILTKIKELKK